ncbi:hypothetical protein [Streptomyces sp. NPDC055005]
MLGSEREEKSMKVLLRRSVWFLAIAGLVLAASAAFLMDALEDNGRATLVISDVEGTWTAAGGGRLTVSADGSAELERVTEPEVNCGQSSGAAPLTYTGPAMWEFDAFPDEASGIRFDFRGPTPGSRAGSTWWFTRMVTAVGGSSRTTPT